MSWTPDGYLVRDLKTLLTKITMLYNKSCFNDSLMVTTN